MFGRFAGLKASFGALDAPGRRAVALHALGDTTREQAACGCRGLLDGLLLVRRRNGPAITCAPEVDTDLALGMALSKGGKQHGRHEDQPADDSNEGS